MGYTHYWTIKSINDPEKFKLYSQDCKKIVDKCKEEGITLWHEYDEPGTEPETSDTQVWFNGAEGEGHETFEVNIKSTGSSFCKTAYKPYDVAVTAVLIALKHHYPDVEISSDGSNNDWEDGSDLCERVVGYSKTFSIED